MLKEHGLAGVAKDEAIADLVRLAADPAYADARWRPLTPGARGTRQSSGSFPAASS
jgi:hypothetical protein